MSERSSEVRGLENKYLLIEFQSSKATLKITLTVLPSVFLHLYEFVRMFVRRVRYGNQLAECLSLLGALVASNARNIIVYIVESLVVSPLYMLRLITIHNTQLYLTSQGMKKCYKIEKEMIMVGIAKSLAVTTVGQCFDRSMGVLLYKGNVSEMVKIVTYRDVNEII